MSTIVADDTDTVVEQIITALQRADADGVHFLPARDLYRASQRDRFHDAMGRAQRDGRITSRRVHVGNHQRRRYVALPHNADFLPGGGR